MMASLAAARLLPARAAESNRCAASAWLPDSKDWRACSKTAHPGSCWHFPPLLKRKHQHSHALPSGLNLKLPGDIQNALRITPPSTRSAAPVVAEARRLAT